MSLATDCTIDPAELAHYEAAAGHWWDRQSVARWLHRYNLVRVPYIRDAACRQFGRDAQQADCLRDLRILDIGCGGGVLCEPLAQLGASVVGLDPARTAIDVARRHARETGIIVEYRCDTMEALLEAGEKFDVVLAMEVIEHVASSDVFLDRCAGLVSPGGLTILSTINRTVTPLRRGESSAIETTAPTSATISTGSASLRASSASSREASEISLMSRSRRRTSC